MVGVISLRGDVILLPCVGRVGLVIMLVVLLETVNVHSFDRMCGSVVCHLESGLADYLTCRCLTDIWQVNQIQSK
jgi:hypothetical protein